MAVLNANYLRVKVRDQGFPIACDRVNMHEFVAQPPKGLRTLDFAKALLDYGVHPMTVYFPLVVSEAMMMEPTETESLETMDRYAEILGEIPRADDLQHHHREPAQENEDRRRELEHGAV